MMKERTILTLRSGFTLLCAMLLFGYVNATTWVVTNPSDVGYPSGSLRKAIALASSGDIIDIQVSNITLLSTLNINKSLTISSNPGIGKVAITTASNIPTTSPSYRAIEITTANVVVTFNDIIFRDHQYVVDGSADFGGGLMLISETATFNNCEFLNIYLSRKNGSGVTRGGVINHLENTLTLDSCVFEDILISQATGQPAFQGRGGAIYSAGNLVVNNSSFKNSGVKTQSFADGGAIYCSNNSGSIIPAIYGSTFEDCYVSPSDPSTFVATYYRGGAIATNQAITIQNSLFKNNSATSYLGNATTAAWAYGGAIYLNSDPYGAAMIIDQTTFLNNKVSAASNQGEGYGGAIACYLGKMEIYNTTLEGNLVSNTEGGVLMGGAVYTHGANCKLENVTMSGNHVYSGAYTGSSTQNSTILGGGIYFASGELKMRHCTVYNNKIEGKVTTGTSTRYGSGVLVTGVSGSTVFRNNIVGGNIALNGSISNANMYGAITSNSGNLIETYAGSFSPATDVTGVAPALLALANNGGSTKTHALQCASPARNIGVTGTTTYTTDQRGAVRPFGGGVLDAGAYEAEDLSLVTISAPTSVCRGGCVSVTANGPDFSNYQWITISPTITSISNGTAKSFCMALSETTTFRLSVTDNQGCVRTIDFTITVNQRCSGGGDACCQGTEKMSHEEMTEDFLTVSPNPSNGQFQVKAGFATEQTGEAASIQVFDQTGKLVYTTQVEGGRHFMETRIDLSQLPDGIYMLRLASGEKVQTSRIVKAQ